MLLRHVPYSSLSAHTVTPSPLSMSAAEIDSGGVAVAIVAMRARSRILKTMKL